MSAGQHRPPSRARYAAAHPTIALHPDRPMYDRLLALRSRTGLSLTKLALRALGQVELQVDTVFAAGRSEGYSAGHAAGWQEGYAAGHAAAVEQFQLAPFCARCSNDVVIEPGSDLWDFAVGLLNAELPGYHACVPKWKLTRRQFDGTTPNAAE